MFAVVRWRLFLAVGSGATGLHIASRYDDDNERVGGCYHRVSAVEDGADVDILVDN